VTDRFGDSGLVGLMSFAANGTSAKIVDFVLSCRVMGRRVEEAMLHQLLQEAGKLGLSGLEADYLATKKNEPCLKFLERNTTDREGNLFRWKTNNGYQPPQFIAVEATA